MLALRLVALFLMSVLAAQPCIFLSKQYVHIWAKTPGSASQLFAFQQGGKVGFIDANGAVVIPASIDVSIRRVGDFVDGLVRIGDEGYLTESGEWAFRGPYPMLGVFSDGLARVIFAEDDPRYADLESHYLDVTGRVATTLPVMTFSPFSDGLFAYGDDSTTDGLFGFMDRTGQVVVQPLFAEVGSFSDGMARVVTDGYCHIPHPDDRRFGTPTTGYTTSCGTPPDDAQVACPVGFIDKTGDFAIGPLFESALDFSEDLAAVRIDGLWGFIDRTGQVVIPADYAAALPFRDGRAGVKVGAQWGFIDTTGEIVVPPRYAWVDSFSESLVVVGDQDEMFYIGGAGETVIPGPFLEATPFVHGLAAVRLTDRHVAYINKAGVTVFDYFLD